ncbi:MAG: flagellar biosynthetic protein FliR [Rhodospirillales bacterium]|nr:flagellar biosynthetic protein FliR [Rhodospirillales bacterium]
MADPALAPFLAHLPDHVFAVLLIFARVSGAVVLLPAFGEQEIPPTIRLAIAFALAILLAPVLGGMPRLPAVPFDLARLMAAETVTGLWLGFLARALALALPAAGSLAAGALGIANVLQPDADLGPGASALAAALQRAVPALVLAANLHAPLLMALAGSYALIPVGQVLPAPSLGAVMPAVADAFALTLRLAAPFLFAGLLWSGLLGLAVRLVPRLQIYFAAMPGQVLAGLLLLAGLTPMLLGVWTRAMADAFARFAGG